MASIEPSSVITEAGAGGTSTGPLTVRSDPRAHLIKLIDSRVVTDRRMSKLWAVVPAFILWIFVSQLVRVVILYSDLDSHEVDDLLNDVLFASYLVSIPLFGILFGIMICKMLKRINLHMSREDSLRAEVMSFLREAASSAGKGQEIVDGLLRLSAFNGQAVTYEKRHSPLRWGAGISVLFLMYPLAIVGVMAATLEYDYFFAFAMVSSLGASVTGLVFLIASAYIVNSIMSTSYTHDVRWKGFAASTAVVLHMLGKVGSSEWRHVPLQERSLMLFVVLTVITAGFFLFYWFYVLVEDMNRHFQEQHRFEDMLRTVLTSPAPA